MRITSRLLLRLMHRNYRGRKVARRLVATPTGYDWEGRPEPPINPGCWLDQFSHTYHRFHRREKVPAGLAAHMDAEARFDNYPRDWPSLPSKAVRQAVRLGWISPTTDEALAVTPAGRAAWHQERFGYGEGKKPPRRSRKRRPQGERKMFSAYRWHVEGRNYKGSTPQPAPHIRLRAREGAAKQRGDLGR